MTISTGDTLPGATLYRMGEGGPEAVEMSDLAGSGKVVIFGLPAAFSGTCSNSHVPSFIGSMGKLKDKGVDEVICVSVNDAFTMGAWDESLGASKAGIHMLGDASGGFTKAVGMDFDAPAIGFFGRSKRYSMLVEDGVVKAVNIEENPGACEISGGEAILDSL